MTNPLEILPTEVVEAVFSNLDLTDLLSCSRVSRLWNSATGNDFLWKKLCISRGWKKCYEFDNCIDYFESFSDEEIQCICCYGTWKKYFVLRNRIKYNCNQGSFRQSQVVVRPEAGEITCASATNTILALGCSKGIVQVFDIKGEPNLIQTIRCKKQYLIRSVSLTTENLAFCSSHLLFLFKANNKEGTYEFCSIEVIGRTNDVVSILDSSNFIADQHDEEDTRPEDSVHQVGLTFCMNDDFLVASSPILHAIFVWNLSTTTTIEPVHMFEHEKGTIDLEVQCIDLTDDVVSVVYCIPDQQIWFVEAFSLKDNIQLYCGEKIHEPIARVFETNVMDSDVSLQISSSYTLISIFITEISQYKVNLYNKNGKLIYERFAAFIDIKAYPEDSDFIAIEKTDSLIIYNPKTDSTIFSIDMQGVFIGIIYGVLVTECDEFDRFGSSGPKIEFWRLKYSQQSEGPFLVLPKDFAIRTGAFSETSILFIGASSLFMLNFMV